MHPTWNDSQIVGVLKEVKEYERRVALTPQGAKDLSSDGRRVIVETDAGTGSGYSDDEYRLVGAEIASGPVAVAEAATLLLHVKEPQPSEFALFAPPSHSFYLSPSGCSPSRCSCTTGERLSGHCL